MSIQVEGIEHVPRRGPIIYVPNHSGWFTLDTLVGALAIADHLGLDRLPWAAVVDQLLRTPKLGLFFERIGGFPASWLKTPEAMPPEIDALCIYPEGPEGNCKSFLHAYQMRPWRTSFIHLAALRGAAIVPLAIIGAEESLPAISGLPFLRRYIGTILPLPLTPIPLPAKWKFVFHEPVYISRSDLGPEGGDFEARRERARELALGIRARLQLTLDRETADHKLVRFSKMIRRLANYGPPRLQRAIAPAPPLESASGPASSSSGSGPSSRRVRPPLFAFSRSASPMAAPEASSSPSISPPPPSPLRQSR
ncbi:1-acyl-sn-glycerol-3-phosphate acyltransferase [Pendulispora albinea]|uniref:1-acyl-sn-glycerol-3-phosphate acyltransferase n=1 Tax=Pendulispora albinea TaxID=2741071 RepID=A0ABZ2LM44_9BACT